MLEGLGEFWAIQTLAIKTFPGCHYFQTACSALEAIAKRQPEGLRACDIESVLIETTKLGAEVTRFGAYYADRDRVTHVNVNFDLATTAALMIVAGKLTGTEVEPPFLDRHSSEILALKRRIAVKHDPRLTLRMLDSGMALPTGRRAIASLGVRDLMELRRRYKAEYSSTLFSSSELVRWLKGIVARRRRKPRAQDPQTSAVPLQFANRVTVQFTDGRRGTAQVDVPVGSFCLPAMEALLLAKLARASESVLGSERAERVFRSALELEKHELNRIARPAIHA